MDIINQDEVNGYFIKISGKIPFHRFLARGEDIDAVIDGHKYILNRTKVEGFDQQNGTDDVVFVLKSLME